MSTAASALPGTAEFTGLDTNVLLRAFLQDDPIQSPIAARLIEELTPQRPGFITQAVLVEFYWVMRRSLRLPVPVCLEAIYRLLTLPSIEFDDSEGVVRALELAQDGADFPDALIHTSFEQFQVTRGATFDRRAALQFGWQLLDE
ncbi:MAG: type II toxin-antitoxin system VapC family toxin [Actinobacteria bacterium]|nr:type II toxin-antitoxin system VapC family toxin [Actinomycetota bacterium]